MQTPAFQDAAAWVALCAGATAALLVAERRDWRLGKWIAKPLASAAFLAVALAGHAWREPYGAAVLVGLALSMAGDVLLIPSGAGRYFRLGAASFLAGHVAYCAAFLVRGVDPATTAGAAVATLAAAAAVLAWLGRVVPVDMKMLVRGYVAVISAMLTLAAGTWAAGGDARIALGALAFYVSDLSVARDRFAQPAFSNRLWGLPLYYAGQVLLALSAAA